MEKINLTMSELKVLTIAGGSYATQQILELVLVQGQPFINGVIGILTVIYLFKRILTTAKVIE